MGEEITLKMNTNTRRSSVLFRNAARLMLDLNLIFVFLNPDRYLGIADYYYFFVLFIILCVLSKNIIPLEKESKHVIAIGGYVFLSTVIALFQGVFSSGYFFSYVVYLVVFLLMLSQDYSSGEIKHLINMYILAGVLISIILFVQRYDYYGSGNERHTIKILSNDPIDPNFISAFLVVPAVMSIAKTFYQFNMKNSLSFLIIIAAIIYTASRGAALSTFAGLGIVVISFFKEKRMRIRLIVIIALILAASYLIISKFIPQSSLIRIVNTSLYYDSSNAKRLLDWQYGLRAFVKHPIFGYGIQGEMRIIQSVIGVNYISHNTFLAFLLQFGITGCLIIGYGLFRLYSRIKTNAVLLAILTSTLFVSFFVSGEVALFFWIPIMMVVTISAYERKEHTTNDWLC